MRDELSSRTYTLKYTLLLFILGMAVSIVLGWMIYKININKYFDGLIQVQQKDVTQSLVIFSQEIKGMEDTIKVLHHSPSMRSSLAVHSPLDRKQAEATFVAFIRTFEPLMQVRWLDDKGEERVRVDGKGGVYTVIPEHALQNKKSRYYFSEGIQSPKGEVYLSALDLNIEHGQIELPYRPTIKVQLEIVDQRGFWIMHPDKSYEWGYDLDRKEHNIKLVNPDIWKKLEASDSRASDDIHFGETKSGLFTYKCTNVAQGFSHNQQTQNTNLCFIAKTPSKVITAQKLLIVIPAFIVSLLLALSLSWIIYRERKMGLTLIKVNQRLANDKVLLEQSERETRRLLGQQQRLQEDLIESGKLSALGMMVAGVAHELNTPLGAAIMAASTIKKEHQLLAESFANGLTKDALQRYLESTEMGLDLVETNQQRAAQLVRSFKRLAIDRATEDIVSFMLDQVIDDLMKTLHHRLKTARVDVELNVEHIEMQGIPGILSQVLQNLVINALNHAFKPEMGGKLVISAAAVDGNVTLKVADNGKGIDSNIVSKIFEPFVTSKRSNGNTGLGMHFVHQWVTRSLHGSVTVETELNRGTTFIICIPQTLAVDLPSD